jgi:PAS domain S-box-containing protein
LIKKHFIKIIDSSMHSISELNLVLHTINSFPECISITDVNDIILYVNQAFTTTYGYSSEELMGKSIVIVRSDKNDPEKVKEILPATLEDSWHGRLWNKRKDGTDFLIELHTSIVRDEKFKPVAYVGIARDLTEQIKTEDTLRDAQDKFKTLFTELKDAFYESTPDGRLIELNPYGMELLGIKSQKEFRKINIAKDFYSNKQVRDDFKNELEKYGFVKDYENNIHTLCGEIVTVLETSYAVRDKEGKIISYRGILRDITEQKKNEIKLEQLVERLELVNKQLKESEEGLKDSNASKDKFFSIIAHDLRSPFNSLLNFSEFLLEDINELSKEDIKSFAEKINESAKSVFGLLENLLQWSRIQSGKVPFQPTSFNISFKTNQIIKLLSNNAEQKGIKIINKITSNLIVFADEDMIFSVIQNLLSNAIKFTNKDGSITFHSAIKEKGVEISITDTGVGISKDTIEKLFQIDSQVTTTGTNDEKGSGLGLILCKEMIEKNNGSIWVSSKVGEGTTFTFTIPQA